MTNASQPRHPIDPVAAGIGDGVHYGFQAVEAVAEGLRESLLMRANRPTRGARSTADRPAADRPAAGAVSRIPAGGTAGGSGAVSGELLRLFAEALDMAGEVAQEVARTLAHPHQSGHDQEVTLEEVEVYQEPDGSVTPGSFTIWNTGHAALQNVTFNRTDVIGPNPIAAEKVTFIPPDIAVIAPGTGVTVQVTVDIPETPLITGENRGVITADPGGTVLLTVRPRR